MFEKASTASDWLDTEDTQCREGRLSRLNWLIDNSPEAVYWTFPGGLLAKSLFEEMRYCFVYGQFLATTILGLAYIERTLAALFYARGRDDLKRAGVSKLLKEAHTRGMIVTSEYQQLDNLRRTRNIYSHFRRPGQKESVALRAVTEHKSFYSVIEEDATVVVTAALRMVEKDTV